MKPHLVAPRLTGHLEVSTDLGAFLGDKRVRLLEAIARHGSITQDAVAELGLKPGLAASAVIKASQVVLGV